ncbi:GNAT family N-acetyltransferase [Demequina aurantiaca]|uniref:GNAT family N-acetyltransferase n=1 Tax=Demequina aurantiaca TaxID=676200 RepID=UPI003D358188
MIIRPAEPADRDAIARICLLTGDVARDATGVFCDDAAISDVYATPYLYGPGGFAVVWDVDGEPRGYVLGTDDTVAFQEWFTREWWPRVGAHRTQVTAKDEWLLAAAADPERMLEPHVAQYPAHLHIDLLPEAQGKGAGRALIEAAVALLAKRGVGGVHLGADAANAGALAFYPRVGFEILSRDAGGVLFGRRIAADFPAG